MADLDVQPKKKSKSILPWILLALGLLALIIFLARGCNDDNNADTIGAAADSSGNAIAQTADTATTRFSNWWENVDMNAPAARFDEITNRDIDVRGNDNYGIYGISEVILFDEGKSTIKPKAEANLKQVVASINKRYQNGNVRIYGYTDTVGSTSSNQQLAQQRADAVKNWLIQSGNIPSANVTTHPIGEAQATSGANEQNRKQDRRVQIVAGRGESGSTGSGASGSGGTGGAGDTSSGRTGSAAGASGDTAGARRQ